jgi:hypothetical protein
MVSLCLGHLVVNMENGIAKPEDFRQAVERASVERVVLPVSGLAVLLCRPPIFAALRMGREGTELQNRIAEAKPEEIKPEDITAFSDWLNATLARLFVRPRFSEAPNPHEIGLGDLLVDDLKYIFRWLRGEVFTARDSGLGIRDSGSSSANPETRIPNPGVVEDLAPFPGGPRAASVPGGSGEARSLSSERIAGAHGDAGVPVGLRRG